MKKSKTLHLLIFHYLFFPQIVSQTGDFFFKKLLCFICPVNHLVNAKGKNRKVKAEEC